MEFLLSNKAVLKKLPALSPNGIEISSSAKPFIEANTKQVFIDELQSHIIPVWTATNEPLISHSEFIETIWEVTHELFRGEKILKPNIRCSHPVKGRIPEAKNKPACELQPWEETLFYERMMFVVEIPTISEKVNCDTLNLMLGGVKSYNIDNIYAKRTQCEQNFKLFIGFQNKICCNLCVWSDGFKEEISIKSISQLYYAAQNLFSSFNAKNYLDPIKDMGNIEVTETDFAKIIGRSRMYKYMPEKYKKEIPPLLFGDQQMGAVVNSYYNDENFGLPYGGSMALYKLYNLLTGANKSSYIDAFLERGINAFDFSMGVLDHKQNRKQFWYLG